MKKLLILAVVAVMGGLLFPEGTMANPVQKVRITVGQRGYNPSNFRLKKAVPAQLTFKRITDQSCGTEIVIPAYNIRKDLPLNQPVTVNFTPRKSGSFSFTCGMGMFKGKVIIS
jgi:plastocyanin domain-containing protein